MNLFCYIFHQWEETAVMSALPESNYYSNAYGHGYTTTDYEARWGRKCKRCGKEQVQFMPNRWVYPKFINVILE